ncbi:MAG TPA: FtsX-like permease family protein [Symbiobacteriaceae bacterium]|nr:FtsX-like permease family protein [Symbiobacteriaceae bacterium]
MPPELGRISLWRLTLAGLRRSRLRSAAGLLVALIAAGAFFGAATLLIGAGRTLSAGLQQLGADLLVVPQGRGEEARRLLNGEEAGPLPLDVPVAEWKKLLKTGKVVGVKGLQGIALAARGRGEPTGETASLIAIQLESWASPLVAVQEVERAIPGAQVVVAEQATRNVTRNLQPIVRLMTGAAAVALLGAVLMAGLMTSIRVSERRSELGMLRAVGATRLSLIALTLGETTIPALAGAVAGIVLSGLGLAISGSARSLVLRLTYGEIALFAGGALLATLAVMALAGLLPALRAAHMDPLDAVRQGR